MSRFRYLVAGCLGIFAAGLVGLILWAARQGSLWEGLRATAGPPWGLVTLVDLSAGIAVVAIWISILERRWWISAAWIVLLLCLGNLVALVYVVVRLLRHRSVADAFTRRARVCADA